MKPFFSRCLTGGAVIAALFIGWSVGRQSAATEIASLKARAEGEQSRAEAFHRQIQEAASAQRAGPSGEPSVREPGRDPRAGATRDAGERLRMLAELQGNKVIGVNFNIIGRDGNISDGFVTLAGLSASEKKALQRAMDQGRERMDQLILANATARREADTFVVSVKPLEQGPQVYDLVMDEFQRVLGPDRYASFLTLGGKGIGNYFDQFGAEERTVTFWLEDDGDGKPSVMASDVRKSVTGGTGSTIGKRDFNKLPSTHEWMKQFAAEVTSLPPRPKQSARP